MGLSKLSPLAVASTCIAQSLFPAAAPVQFHVYMSVCAGFTVSCLVPGNNCSDIECTSDNIRRLLNNRLSVGPDGRSFVINVLTAWVVRSTLGCCST